MLDGWRWWTASPNDIARQKNIMVAGGQLVQIYQVLFRRAGVQTAALFFGGNMEVF